MKHLEVNFRHPNVDRLVEIVSAARELGFNFKIRVDGLPKGYQSFVESLGVTLNWTLPGITSDLFCEYPEPGTDFDYTLGARTESVEVLKNRIASTKKIENPSLGETCRSLLKAAYQRFGLNRDQLQTVVHVGYAIACLEQAKHIEAHHIAEAIQYIRDPLL